MKQKKKTGEHQVILRDRKSNFVEIFRTTPPRTVCPNFFVLAHADGCAFAPRCSYCYLKSSFRHVRGQHVFTNADRMLRQVRAWIKRDRLESYILNTGNLSDSLTFEKFRPLMNDLVDLFRREAEAKGRKHTLLIVTKGGLKECRVFLKAKSCANVVISFSVNDPDAAKQHEAGAAPVKERLRTANLLKKKGWRIRMRIDPMMIGFDYTWIARQVRKLKPERITLGTLRAESGLERFVKKGLFDELEPTKEPRAMARYPRAVRLALYRKAIHDIGRKTCPFGLCEETRDVWLELGLDIEAKSCNCGS